MFAVVLQTKSSDIIPRVWSTRHIHLEKWSNKGNMIYVRALHTSTLLTNGKVLVVGGSNGSRFLNSAELYDPLTRIWRITNSMNMSRFDFTATLLTNGFVLIAGGVTDENDSEHGNELYNSSTEKWVPTNNLNTQRFGHSAFLLANGQVLDAGRFSDHFLNTAELYHPSMATWKIDQKINQTRYQNTPTVLDNGKVLMAGGANHQGYLNSTELYSAFQISKN